MPEQAPLDYIDLGLNDVSASDGSFVLLPPGQYGLEVTKVEGGQSKAGNPKMVLHLKVFAALQEANENQIGQVVQSSMVLDKGKEFARRRLKNVVQACGVAIDDRGGFNPQEMLEGRILAEVKLETYTEQNAMTGEKVERPSMRIFNEKPWEGDEPEADEPEEETEEETEEPEEPAKEEKPKTSKRRQRRTPAR